jgi:hypothetical protein
VFGIPKRDATDLPARLIDEQKWICFIERKPNGRFLAGVQCRTIR